MKQKQTAQEFVDSIKEDQRKFHADRIKTVLSTEVPQHILATKSICDDLVVGEDGYCSTEAGFFFREKLVNKLMYLAYLHGCESIDRASFNKGYYQAAEEMQEYLNRMHP